MSAGENEEEQHKPHRAGVQQMSVSKEEVPPEPQDWRTSLDQENPPEMTHIKEEQEELWTGQEGEQLRGLEEADITEFTFTHVPVKSEEDEKQLQSSRLHQRHIEQIKLEADGEDCGGPEPTRNFNPDSDLQTHDETSDSSEPETDDSCDWEETRVPQSGLNLQNHEQPVRDIECIVGKTSISFSESATSLGHKGRLQKNKEIQTGVKSFSCSVCSKIYNLKNSLRAHMRLHSEGKRFSCSVCKKTFQWRRDVTSHMRIHTGEKPFLCSVCGLSFTQNSNLTTHVRIHTGEKPFSCSVCKTSFSHRSNLYIHMRQHTGEKPFSCSVCGKGFARNGNLRQHLIVHRGEKPSYQKTKV